MIMSDLVLCGLVIFAYVIIGYAICKGAFDEEGKKNGD